MLASMTLRMLTVTAALVVPLTLAAGCGSSSDSATDSAGGGTPSATVSPSSPSTGSSTSPSTSPAPTDWAGCQQVWKDRGRLPAPYPGCAQAGIAVPAHRIGCSSGQTIITYADHYFAVPGGRITHTKPMLRNSSVYAAAIATCRG